MNRLYVKSTATVVEFKPENPCLIGATTEGASGESAYTRRDNKTSNDGTPSSSFKKGLWEE